MLNQLVCTRCYPYLDIKSGKSTGKEGMGIFAISKNTLEVLSEKERVFLERRLVVPNASNELFEIGLINSYEYIKVNNQFALIYEYHRSKNTGVRKNGVSHRPNNYVKQCLVGSLSERVENYIESDVWDAYLISENDYYLDDDIQKCGPDLPLIDDSILEKNISDSIIDDFVSSGRKELVQKSILYIAHEMSKPETERGVLVIKDESTNVLMWILSILRVFPKVITNTITFSTNIALDGLSLEHLLFQKCEENDGMIPSYMIVGYHPLDKYASIVKFNNTRLCVLDGRLLTTTIPDEFAKENSWSESATNYKDEYKEFRNLFLDSMQGSVSPNQISGLFVAYDYILSKQISDYKYSDLVNHLLTMKSCDYIAEAVRNKLLEKIIDYINYENTIEIPQLLTLSKLIWEFAENSKYKDLLCDIWVEILDKVILLQDRKAIKYLCDATVNDIDCELLKYVFACFFTEDMLNELILTFYQKTYDFIRDIFTLFFVKKDICEEDRAQIVNNELEFKFVYCGVEEIYNDLDSLSDILCNVIIQPNLVEKILNIISHKIMSDGRVSSDAWWELLLNVKHINIKELCVYICDIPGVSIDVIEKYLCGKVEDFTIDNSELLFSFEYARGRLGGDENAGMDLCVKILNNTDNLELSKLIRSLRNTDYPITLQKKLFNYINTSLRREKNRVEDIYIELQNWSVKLGVVSEYCENIDLARNVKSHHSKKKLPEVLGKYIDLDIVYYSGIVETEWYQIVLSVALKRLNGNVNACMFCLFSFDNDEDRKAYIKYIVDAFLKNISVFNTTDVLVSLCEPLVYEYDAIPKKKAMSDWRVFLEDALVISLEDIYSKRLVRNIQGDMSIDLPIKKRLLKILDVVNENIVKKRPKGLFSIFK